MSEVTAIESAPAVEKGTFFRDKAKEKSQEEEAKRLVKILNHEKKARENKRFELLKTD